MQYPIDCSTFVSTDHQLGQLLLLDVNTARL